MRAVRQSDWLAPNSLKRQTRHYTTLLFTAYREAYPRVPEYPALIGRPVSLQISKKAE